MQETSTEKLQESEVQIVPSDICTQKMKSTDIEDNLIVCAGGNKKGPCKVFTTTMFTIKLALFAQGDSGGPLTVVKDSSHVLIGIVSTRLGESCNEQDHAVFTSVAALRPWIEDSITENGGMASCGFTLSAPPTLGFYSSDTRYVCKENICRRIIGASSSTRTSCIWWSIQRGATHLC